MNVDAALVKEQGVLFAVVTVKSHVLQNRTTARETQQAFSQWFPGYHVVLMTQDARGAPTFFGRPDIVRFLSNVPISALPWSRYSQN